MTESDRKQHDQFLRLFIEHEAALRLFVRSQLFDIEEAGEVMQGVAVVLWRKFDPEMDSLSFRRWAFGVARMEAISFRRDRARDRHAFGDDVVGLLAQTVQEESSTMDAERLALECCLKKLPDDQRELVQAAYAPGVRIGDFALRLGCTAMAVYKRLHKIRLQLVDCTRKLLASEELT